MRGFISIFSLAALIFTNFAFAGGNGGSILGLGGGMGFGGENLPDIPKLLTEKKMPVIFLVAFGEQTPRDKANIEKIRKLEQQFKGKAHFVYNEVKDSILQVDPFVQIYVPVLDENGKNTTPTNLPFSGFSSFFHQSSLDAPDLKSKIQESIQTRRLYLENSPVVMSVRRQQQKLQADINVITEHLEYEECRTKLLEIIAKDKDSPKQKALEELHDLRTRRVKAMRDLAQAEFDSRAIYGKLPSKVQVSTSFERYLQTSESEDAVGYRFLESNVENTTRLIEEKSAALDAMPPDEIGKALTQLDKECVQKLEKMTDVSKLMPSSASRSSIEEDAPDAAARKKATTGDYIMGAVKAMNGKLIK